MTPSKAAQEPGRRATAYHEAGHAVMALRLGRRVGKLSIEGTRDGAGYVEREDAHWPRTRTQFHEEIMILLAGPVAERNLLGAHASHGWERDLKHAGILATKCTASQTQMCELVGRLERETLDKLREPANWSRVRALATALLERGQLDGPAALQIVERAKGR